MAKIMLAYSGGLDSAVVLHWLAAQGHEVVAFTAQLGGHPPEFEFQAIDNGAVRAVVEDLRKPWIQSLATTARQMDAVYGNYLLHVALGKVIIAERMAELAAEYGIEMVAHGAHKGENDYHRFKSAFTALATKDRRQLTVYAPWEDPTFRRRFPDRDALLRYTQQHSMKFSGVGTTTLTSEPTILGVNYENGLLACGEEVSDAVLNLHRPQSAEAREITLRFRQGNLIELIDARDSAKGITAVVTRLDKIGRQYGLGVSDSVETNIDGSKARCVYVQPATSLWHAAHMELGALLLSKSQLARRDYISRAAGQLIYSGQWFSKEMEALQREACRLNQAYDGWVTLRLHPGFSRVVARGAAA